MFFDLFIPFMGNEIEPLALPNDGCDGKQGRIRANEIILGGIP